jgi:hypothetical protein
LGLNIPYPYEIDWFPEEGKPIGLFAMSGWIEERVKEMKAHRDKMERKSKGFTETHVSDVSESDGGD